MAKALAVQAETPASTEPPLIIWPPSHVIRCQTVTVFDPTVKKHVTYCGLICPSIKTNIVEIWSNKVKIWVNKVKIKYK